MIGLLIFVGCMVPTIQHGYLAWPPNRSSLWRYGYDTPKNYNDNALYCGGRKAMEENKGKCGPCGDRYDGNRDHEAGGMYASGIIVAKYPTNTKTIEASVLLTTNHKGYFDFRLCPHNNLNIPVQQECLDRFVLPIKEGLSKYQRKRFYPKEKDGPTYNLTLEIPRGVICSQCVLQWRYRTGNSWGISTNGTGCLGCGIQEEFYNCADISIGMKTLLNFGKTRPFAKANSTSEMNDRKTGPFIMRNANLIEYSPGNGLSFATNLNAIQGNSVSQKLPDENKTDSNIRVSSKIVKEAYVQTEKSNILSNSVHIKRPINLKHSARSENSFRQKQNIKQAVRAVNIIERNPEKRPSYPILKHHRRPKGPPIKDRNLHVISKTKRQNTRLKPPPTPFSSVYFSKTPDSRIYQQNTLSILRDKKSGNVHAKFMEANPDLVNRNMKIAEARKSSWNSQRPTSLPQSSFQIALPTNGVYTNGRQAKKVALYNSPSVLEVSPNSLLSLGPLIKNITPSRTFVVTQKTANRQHFPVRKKYIIVRKVSNGKKSSSNMNDVLNSQKYKIRKRTIRIPKSLVKNMKSLELLSHIQSKLPDLKDISKLI